LICLIYYCECSFRVFAVSFSPNCPLIIRKPQHSDWQIAVCACFVSCRKTYSYVVNNKIQVINHVLWKKCFAWFNIQGLYRIAFYKRARVSVCVCVCDCSRTVCWGIKLKAERSRVRFRMG
jgi:hypothetical protein